MTEHYLCHTILQRAELYATAPSLSYTSPCFALTKQYITLRNRRRTLRYYTVPRRSVTTNCFTATKRYYASPYFTDTTRCHTSLCHYVTTQRCAVLCPYAAKHCSTSAARNSAVWCLACTWCCLSRDSTPSPPVPIGIVDGIHSKVVFMPSRFVKS